MDVGAWAHATGDEWLAFSGYRKEANLAYQLRDDARLKIDLSFRVQNLKDNSNFDGFSSGKNTLRGRVGVNYQINKRWSVGTDVTQDLLNRGDGTTLSVGASYGLPLSERSTLSLSAGVNWATADHWGYPAAPVAPSTRGLACGLGLGGFGPELPLCPHPTMGLVWHGGQLAPFGPGRHRQPQHPELERPDRCSLLQPMTPHACLPF